MLLDGQGVTLTADATIRALEALGQMHALLVEGRELAMRNHRRASQRHALMAWGDRVEAALRELGAE